MRISFLLIFLAALSFTACKEYKTTDTGLQYKFFTQDKNGRKAKLGDVIKVHYQVQNDKDSVIFTTFKRDKPMVLPVSPAAFKGDLAEGFLLMSKGDSALFLVNADSLLKVQPGFPGAKAGEFLKFTIKMVDVMTKDEFEKQQRTAHEARAKAEDEVIQKYMKDSGIVAQKSMTGLYYVIERPGAGPMPVPGNSITVHYRGKLLNGTVFDESFKRGEPITFPVGEGRVIPGWDEGLTYFNKGSKGKLIIPSYLAYGERDMGPIPPSSILVFDIEVMDIKNEPAPAPEPQK